MKTIYSLMKLLTVVIMTALAYPSAVIAAESTADGKAEIILNNFNCEEKNKFVLQEYGAPDKVLLTALGTYLFKVPANLRGNSTKYFYSVKVCTEGKECPEGGDSHTKYLEAYVGDKFTVVCAKDPREGECVCNL